MVRSYYAMNRAGYVRACWFLQNWMRTTQQIHAKMHLESSHNNKDNLLKDVEWAQYLVHTDELQDKPF